MLENKSGENELTQFPLTVAEIVYWYRSKQSSLERSEISLVDIRERDSGPKPAAGADFDGPGTMGRIDGWVSGEFDFHVLRVSDGKDIFWRHVDASVVGELESTYADFLRNLHNPD